MEQEQNQPPTYSNLASISVLFALFSLAKFLYILDIYISFFSIFGSLLFIASPFLAILFSILAIIQINKKPLLFKKEEKVKAIVSLVIGLLTVLFKFLVFKSLLFY